MSDDASQRLDELKLLWESDPSSKVYLQLASVYRQKGQLDKAVEVLETSLQHRPRDPRGRVALARCKMELKDDVAAAELLEEVIRLDAAHVDANKQLLECYLRLGDAAKAEERLGIYRLLNDRDPELDHLEYRLSSLHEGGDGEEPAASEPAAPEPVAPDLVVPESASLEPAAPLEEARLPEPVAPEPLPAAPEPAAPEPAAPEPAAPEPMEEPAYEQPASDDLFDLAPAPEPVDEDPWGGDLFDLASPDSAPSAEPDLGGLWEQTEIVDLEDEDTDGDSDEDEGAQEASESAPFADQDEEEDRGEADEGGSATATLGLLYLRQGHLDEAERIFRKVLSQAPDNEAALAGLQQLQTQRLAAEAAELEEMSAFEADDVSANDVSADDDEPAEGDERAGESVEGEVELEPVAEPEVFTEPEPIAVTFLDAEPESSEPEPVPDLSATDTEEPDHQIAEAGHDIEPAARVLTAQALLGRAALEGGIPADTTGRKIAMLQQYIQQIRTASGDHVH